MISSQLCRDRLIIFTRYPEPGKTKTRLIPALGSQGAARLQRRLTEHTLDRVRSLESFDSLSIEVRYAGGNLELMQDWLGSDWVYQPQGNGNLGDRLIRACDDAFGAGSERVVIVGIDCPDLDAPLLSQAFEQLPGNDLVLGPALDGGYYLIGLRRSIPALFTGISWGTGEVLQQTQAIARSLSLSIGYLPPLQDLDRPEDLPLLDSHFPIPDLPKQISIVLPVLNEARILPQTLQRATAATNVEALVVDGGSRDGTAELAESLGAKVISSPPGRACQMNAGAAVASGEILLFLHADTLLPVGFDSYVRECLARPEVVGGAFKLQIASSSAALRLIEMGVNWRSRFLQMPYGDQAIFVRARVFRELGGFPDLPIMEDFEFIHQLRRRGRIAIAPVSVLTSARRWEKLGVLKTTAINQWVIMAYSVGVSPDRLVRWYRRER